MPAQRFVLVGLAVLALAAGATGVAAADFQAELDLPAEPTAGERVTVGGSVSTEDRPGDWDAEVTITLYIDGAQVARRTVTVRDGETASVAFDHTFDSAGDHDVRVEGEADYARRSYSDSVTRTVSVAAAPTDTPTVETARYEGAAFAVPPGLEDEVTDLREGVDDLGPRAFVLATESELYLVFTDAEPASGTATVTGATTGETVSVEGLSLSVVAATESSFATTGERVALSDLVADPARYELELVQARGTSSRIATVANTDDGSDVDVPTTAGQLSATGVADSAGGDVLERAVLVTEEDATARPADEGIATTQVRTAFWQETDVRTDGIVVTEDTAARRYLAAVTPESSLALQDGAVLYVVDEERSPTGVDVEDVTAGEIDNGELVRFTAPVGQARVSVEESIEESTSCDDAVPVDGACVPLTQDVTIHAGVAWTGTAGGPEETAVLVGASSRLQQEPVTTATGRYRVTGEVVSAESVDVPTGDAAQVVLVYDLEYLGTVSSLPADVRSRWTTLGEAVETEAAEQGRAVAATPTATPAPTRTVDGGDDGGGRDDGSDAPTSAGGDTTSAAGSDTTSADGSGPGPAIVVPVGVLLAAGVRRRGE